MKREENPREATVGGAGARDPALRAKAGCGR